MCAKGDKDSGVDAKKFRAKVPKTPLDGTDRQVEWATDIRIGQTNLIQAYFTSHGMELREKIREYEGRNIRPRQVEKMRAELGSLGDEAAAMNAALGKPNEAKWFIEHRGTALETVPSEQQLRDNVANVRAGISASYNNLKNALSDDEYLTGQYAKKSRRFRR